jgi:hypothetical protein
MAKWGGSGELWRQFSRHTWAGREGVERPPVFDRGRRSRCRVERRDWLERTNFLPNPQLCISDFQEAVEDPLRS